MINKDQMKARTRDFSLRTIRVCQALPNDFVAKRLGDQLLRAGTSVGANYRAALRARSRREFVSKLGVVVEEADETIYWMELLVEANLLEQRMLEPLMKEADELVSILVATIKTTKQSLV